MKKLNRSNVSHLPEAPIKVLQFGEGNFLRAFVDWMIDLLNEKTDFKGHVQIVQPLEKGMGEAINAQDGLYHVLLEGISKGEKIRTTRLITTVSGVLNPYENYTAFLALAENEDLEYIISNTTEAGIAFDPRDKNQNELPSSFPGKLTALLHHRFEHFHGTPPAHLTVLPCELIDRNGEKLKECVLKYIELWGLSQTFKNWVQNKVLFYNTLVDRIVPGFPYETIEKIQQDIGYEDQLLVKAEPFHLWVIEGPTDLKKRLPFEAAGLNVVLTNDLGPYRTRKVRILNGVHTAMVPVGYLNGFREVREVVEDDTMADFLNQIIFEEIIPTLDMPREDLEKYANEVLDRFRNPFIKHLLLDISLNSISKFRVRVLPSLLGYMEKFDQIPEGLVRAFQYLILFYKGKFGEKIIPLKDAEKHILFFKEVWNLENPELSVERILSNETLWGENLNERSSLRDHLQAKIKSYQ